VNQLRRSRVAGKQKRRTMISRERKVGFKIRRKPKIWKGR